MPISLVRVDDRLIHGQVVESWIPHLRIDEILVVSNEVAKDETRQTIMKFAMPEGVNLKILGIDDAFDYLVNAQNSPKNIFVLLPGLKEAVELINKGFKFSSLNVGGMHYSAGKTQSIGKAIFLSADDYKYLKFIADTGIKIEGRGVPSDKSVNLLEAII